MKFHPLKITPLLFGALLVGALFGGFVTVAQAFVPYYQTTCAGGYENQTTWTQGYWPGGWVCASDYGCTADPDCGSDARYYWCPTTTQVWNPNINCTSTYCYAASATAYAGACRDYAGSYGVPPGATEGSLNYTYDSCTGVFIAYTSGCYAPVCGNGVREGSEVCDNGASNSNSCGSSCNTSCTGATAACAPAPTTASISGPLTAVEGQTFNVVVGEGNNSTTNYNGMVGSTLYVGFAAGTYPLTLSAGSYLLQVQACNASGCSGWISGNTITVTAPPPSCNIALTTGNNPNVPHSWGTYDVYAYGVQNATSVTFPTWSDVGGQDDLVWYQGADQGGGTWKATVNLANRTPDPGDGLYNVHIYMNGNVWCTTANFTRTPAPIPTASITITDTSAVPATGPSTNLTIPVGHNYKWDWSGSTSPNGTSWGSTYASPTCGSGIWVANNSSGTNSGTITPDMLGCTWTVTYTVSGPGGSTPASATVTVVAPPAPVINTFTASPTSLTGSGSVTLSWNVSNAASCIITGGGRNDTGLALPTGSETFAVASTATYNLTCTGL